jgi:hypothetical protein
VSGALIGMVDAMSGLCLIPLTMIECIINSLERLQPLCDHDKPHRQDLHAGRRFRDRILRVIIQTQNG